METKNLTGWEIEKRTHFDEIVENYDKVRPEYPGELFEDVVKFSGPGKGKKALEIGAGTGKATAPFLNVGYNVTAVEIGANMAGFLRERYKKYKSFDVVISSFEDAVLEDDSYDLIYAASAFHWVNAEIGCPKALRLLKSGGVIALLRYNFNFVQAGGDELEEDIKEIYEKHYYNYYKLKNIPARMEKEKFKESPNILKGYGFEGLIAYGFRDVSMKVYDVARTYGADEWIALLGTMSDHRSLPENDRTALYTGVKQAILRHGGYNKIGFIFQLYMGRKP